MTYLLFRDFTTVASLLCLLWHLLKRGYLSSVQHRAESVFTVLFVTLHKFDDDHDVDRQT